MNVIITGATSGIGLSATKLFLERGWKVVMVASSEDRGETLVKEFNQQGFQHVYFCRCNVSKSAEVKNLFDFAMEKLGKIHSIVNNAGVWSSGELHQTEEDVWDWIIDVNIKSIYLTAKYFIPHMIENGGGTIVNTASVSGLLGDYNMAAYNAAKGGVVNLVRAMALDYGKYNIRVNSVCPSACATPLFMANPPEVVDQFNQQNPLKRICTPEEVAKSIYFLASDESSSCNGVNLPVSGGIDVSTGQPVQ